MNDAARSGAGGSADQKLHAHSRPGKSRIICAKSCANDSGRQRAAMGLESGGMWRHATAASITLFWLAMTGLLVRVELLPDSALLRIPVSVVVREVFAHNQTSLLSLFDGERRLGSLILQPRHVEGQDAYTVRVTGSTALPPFTDASRIGWDGTLRLGPAHGFEGLDLDLDGRRPVFHVRLHVDAVSGSHRIEFSQGETPPTVFEGSLEAILGQVLSLPALRGLAIDPRMLLAAGRQVPALEMRATRSRMQVAGRSLETHRLVVSQGGTFQAEIQMTPLGQILTVRTATALRLIAEDLETLAL